MRNHPLVKVLVAILLAVIAGGVTGSDKELFGITYLKIYSFIGQLFLNALHLVVIPLVSASIITGMARMGAEASFRALGFKTIGFYFLTSFIAILIGLMGFLLLYPGNGSQHIVGMINNSIPIHILSQGDAFDKITQIFLKIVPPNILAVASEGQMLGLIFFCILFGFFIPKIDSQAATVVLEFWNGIFQIMMKMTQLVMKALPIGVFGLVAKTIATTGSDSFSSLAVYFFTVIASLLFYALVALPLLIMGVAKANPVLYFRALAPALFTAFSTSSSAATLPITLECMEKRVGISNRICSFTIPLGTSLNMSGGALYLCVASLFIAQVYGIELSAMMISLIILMALITSMGIAGVPSASLISLMTILHTIGVPSEGIGLIMAVDRVLDMFRTTVNVLGNATCALLIADSEGERHALGMKSYSSSKVKEPLY